MHKRGVAIDGVDLHLTRLREMHPLLAQSTASEYAHRSALGLGRHGHEPGVDLKISIDDQDRPGTLYWMAVPAANAAQLDFHRVTEDTAEAIALALAHVANGWVVRRRLQRREFADWLLIDQDRNLVALEVSGVDAVDTGRRRLREKINQVRKCKTLGRKAACVVELRPPRSRMNLA